ncbi:DUF1249 domain-containing protein [Shigella flexneri]
MEWTRYATLVTIEQTAPAIGLEPSVNDGASVFINAMVAEVLSSQQIFRFKARYDYPNKKLHQRDEKHQINKFHGLVAILFSTWSDGDPVYYAS